MKNRVLLDRLHQHQDDILALLRDKEPLLRDPALRDIAGLARARWTLMRAVTAYQLFKHHKIFDPAIGRGTPGEAERAERLKRGCVAAGEKFRGYVSTWSGTDVAGRWAEYQPIALAMVAGLRDHLAKERREITDLLERMG